MDLGGILERPCGDLGGILALAKIGGCSGDFGEIFGDPGGNLRGSWGDLGGVLAGFGRILRGS